MKTDAECGAVKPLCRYFSKLYLNIYFVQLKVKVPLNHDQNFKLTIVTLSLKGFLKTKC